MGDLSVFILYLGVFLNRFTKTKSLNTLKRKEKKSKNFRYSRIQGSSGNMYKLRCLPSEMLHRTQNPSLAKTFRRIGRIGQCQVLAIGFRSLHQTTSPRLPVPTRHDLSFFHHHGLRPIPATVPPRVSKFPENAPSLFSEAIWTALPTTRGGASGSIPNSTSQESQGL